MEYPFTNQLLYIKRNVINVLLRNANSDPFKTPVNAELLGVPQYPKLIKCPMDFGTIKLKLDKRAYQTATECKNDFLDIFRNCYIFNEPGSPYVEMALKLENLFKRKMAELPMPEIYVPESALQAVKLNKVKKMKLPSNTNTPTAPVHKNIGLTLNSIVKTETAHIKKRSRSNSGNGFKDEPFAKKVKSNIDLKTCKHIIMSLMSKNYHDSNRYFLEPVDVEGLKLHDYYSIVKKPMDLGTVKTKLLEGRYLTNLEFAEDIKLIFKNCYLYNPEGHEVRRCGKLLEGVFLKLYQGAFSQNKTPTKHVRHQHNYAEFQPLIHKILKRQTEIDVLNSDILKRNQEIQCSLDYIKNTNVIKTFKASFNCNKKVPVSITKKPSNIPSEPVKQDSINKQLAATIIDKKQSPKSTNVPKPNNHRDLKSDISAPSSNSETVQINVNKHSNQIEPPLHKVPDSNSATPNHKPATKSLKSQSDDVDSSINPKQTQVTADSATFIPIDPEATPKSLHSTSKETLRQVKNTEEFSDRLKEIKVWISDLSEVRREQIREFINKSERKNVAQVNLLKLKPVTINGLYGMMKEKEVPLTNLREFTEEERMKLSHDLSLFGDKYPDKILSIYKKTESVASQDGECEIDFRNMKLVTLHRLREFADKHLQKQREKLKKNSGNSIHRVRENGDDSDSDSSDTSDSDSNSDASSNSSSDAAIFSNMPHTLCAADSSESTTLPVPSNNHVSPIIPPSHSAPQLINKPVPSVTSVQSRLSDSSDSELDDDDPADSSSKRQRFTTPWNKNPNVSNADVRSPAFIAQPKPKPVQIPHPMYNNSARNQLDESLRQIVQDAQAHENVKKQEEELRLIRFKQEEEQKKQHLLKMQAMNESKMKQHSTEQLKKDQEINRLKEKIAFDQKQRNLDIPQAIEREDYHQLLCDFEYNLDHNLIAKFVNLEPNQMHL